LQVSNENKKTYTLVLDKFFPVLFKAVITLRY